MFIAVNDKSDKTYSIYSFLRNNAPDVNIDTLKQISIYIASSNKSEMNDNNLFKLSYDKANNYYVLRLNNKKIIFSNDKDNFGFKILSYDIENKLIMSSDVSLRVLGDMTSLNVYSEIVSTDFGKYVVTFRPNDMSDDSVKFGTINYYTNDEVDWICQVVSSDYIDRDFDLTAKENGIYPFADKSFFDIHLESISNFFDCYDGCLKNYLNRVDLLFNNILVCMKSTSSIKIKQRMK